MESSTNTGKDTLVSTLERIETLDREIKSFEAKIDELKETRSALESIAIEEMAAARMVRGVPAGGRTWRVEWEHSMSVAKDRLPQVMDALRAEGVLDALLTVNTTTLKSWLKDRAKEAGKDARQPFTSGTAFESLVGEYVRPKLMFTSVPSRAAEATQSAF